ncbi:hypothetical protein [Jatrophihabitans sp.]|uniref:hypothetical protein n=1 Tax=Jatrophihabitans sp. TaxID=1932789 RepID=UPI0030C710D9|nr:hypothetical protein [Jatrophihabitans sp.]
MEFTDPEPYTVELVRNAAGVWVETGGPTVCPRCGTPYRENVTRAYQPCNCRGEDGHRTWYCRACRHTVHVPRHYGPDGYGYTPVPRGTS